MTRSFFRHATVPTLLFALTACADGGPLESGVAPPDPQPSEVAEPLSNAALVIEQAERVLDRGEDAAEARRLLVELLSEPEITADEKSAATLALSRAHEAMGDEESAIVVLEKEMATHAEDRGWSSKEFRERLRELLTGSTEAQGLKPRKQVKATAFARFLTKYFPANDDGRVSTTLFVIGGDGDASTEIGTFDVGGGIRAQREEDCPLCTDDIDLHSHRSASDWLMIPVAEARFGEAMLVFYFDLGKNRIPARYERHLPMKVADIEKELSENRSFVMGMEREGAPPVVLIAAPRTALLEDVEKHLAQLDELPTAPVFVDVERRLRPGEIQGVVRDDYFATARGCYDTVLEDDKEAHGRIKIRFRIAEDGVPNGISVDTTEGNLRSEAFVACMHDGLAKVRFPASGNQVTVSYPIVFSPD